MQFFAVHEGRSVGLVNPQFRSADAMELGITVVRRAYRRRGIARALKLLALAAARDRGVTRISTRNHADNAPILALNRSLGVVEVEA